MKNLKNSLLIGLLIASAAACSYDGDGNTVAADANHDHPDAGASAVAMRMLTAPISGHPQSGSTDPIAGAEATLVTTADGASIHFSTAGLTDGNVYTLWWVILNNPEMCAETICGFNDIFVNFVATGADLVQAGNGKVIDAVGDQVFSAYLPKGPLAKGWFDEGFTNPMGADFAIILNNHGPAIDGEVGNMTNSYRGGCTDASIPPPFPDKGKLDGTVGPNTCVLTHEAMFQRKDL